MKVHPFLKMKKYNFMLLSAMLSSGTCGAMVTLPHYITDNMIVQQNSVLRIKGHGTPNSDITVKTAWNKENVKTRSDKNGNFNISLATPAAGGPYSIIFKDKDGETSVENVLSG